MAEDKKKIVCVEDTPEIIDLVRLILKRKGIDLSGAMGGQAGLELMRNLKPDLVLLDLMMPDMDGWEVYRQMKADPALKNIPVIIVTVNAQSLEQVHGLHIDKVDDYVTKPFHPQILLRSVERALGLNTVALPSLTGM